MQCWGLMSIWELPPARAGDGDGEHRAWHKGDEWMVSAEVWLELLARWSLLQAGHTPPAKILAGRRFVLGDLLWGTSSNGVGQQLFKGMHVFASPTQHLLGAKRLAVSWPCCPLLDGCGDPVWRVMPGVTSAVLG